MLVTPPSISRRRAILSGGRQRVLAVVEQAEVHGRGAGDRAGDRRCRGGNTNRHAHRPSRVALLTIAPLPSARERPGPMRRERERGERAGGARSERKERGRDGDQRPRLALMGKYFARLSQFCVCAHLGLSGRRLVYREKLTRRKCSERSYFCPICPRSFERYLTPSQGRF